MRKHRIRRLLVAAIGAWFLVAASQPCCTGAGAGATDPRVVRVSLAIDANRNRIADSLEQRAAKDLSARLAGTQSLDLLVALDHRPAAADRDAAARAGARLLDSFSTLVYSIRVALPAPKGREAAALRRLAAMPGVQLIEENVVGRAVLYQSAKQTGARRAWSRYSMIGRPDHAIAILDTGLDATHPDFPEEKRAGWMDFVGVDYQLSADEYPFYSDKPGHGTSVASVACGSGDAAGIASTAGQLPISQGRCFPSQAGQAYPTYFPVDPISHPGQATVDGQLKWRDTDPGYTVSLCLRTPTDEPLLGPEACTTEFSDGPQPLTASGTLDGGSASFVYSASPSADVAGQSEASAYWVQVKTPMSPLDDEHNLMAGVAPGCRVFAVKVLDDRGLTDAAHFIEALEWLAAQKERCGIIAANMSLDFGARNLQVESTVNALANTGIVCVASAGNRRGLAEPVMTSPARASKCLTVAALSEGDRITDYSSYWTPFDANDKQYKPDLAAPGGSSVTKRGITSADSNEGERNYGSSTQQSWFEPDDYYPDDYATWTGTSMSAPHAAGAAALVGAALLANSPDATTLTGRQADTVKMLLLMTASETNLDAEAIPHPVLNRASGTPRGWDSSEGYGRLNVDAAVEAALSPTAFDGTWRATLGPGVMGQQVWARRIRLRGGLARQFWLDNPPGADYDLYLYSDTPTVEGRPTIAGSSTRAATGGSESFTVHPSMTQDFYLVVKRISGEGEFAVGVWTTSVRLAAGWHLISLPNHPVFPAPADVFSGIPLDMRLYRYDAALQTYVAYLAANPGPFGPIDARAGYWLYLDIPSVVDYLGMPSQSEQQIPLPEQGWHMIGYPFPVSDLIENFEVLDTVSEQRVSFREAVDLGWLEPTLYGWSVDLLGYIAYSLDGSSADGSNRLHPWLGFWLNTLRSQLALIMPLS